MGSLGDGIPRKYFPTSIDHSQSLKSNPHTPGDGLPLSFGEEKQHMCEPHQMAAVAGPQLSTAGQTFGSSVPEPALPAFCLDAEWGAGL